MLVVHFHLNIDMRVETFQSSLIKDGHSILYCFDNVIVDIILDNYHSQIFFSIVELGVHSTFLVVS